MERYNIIHLQDNRILLSSKSYNNWKEIQNEYEQYMTSLSFNSKNEIIEYLKIEYKEFKEGCEEQIRNISDNDTIEIKF